MQKMHNIELNSHTHAKYTQNTVYLFDICSGLRPKCNEEAEHQTNFHTHGQLIVVISRTTNIYST